MKNPVMFVSNGTPDGGEWEPDKNGNLVAEFGDNASTPTHLGISESAAQNMIDEQGLLVDFTNGTGSDLAEHQILKLDNVYTRALGNSNGTLTTDKFLNALSTGSRDYIIGSNDRYNCHGSCFSGINNEEINNYNSLFTDPIAVERRLNNSLTRIDSKDSTFGNTIIAFKRGSIITHTAIFYGRSKNGTAYVFTKNGTQVKPEIMTLDELYKKTNSTLIQVHERYGKIFGYYRN